MERLIVFALVFLLPTQLAYHFWPQSSYIYGLRVDYLAPAIYLTDVLILFLLPHIKKGFYVLFPFFIFALINTIFAQLPLAALLKWLVIFKLIILGMYFYYKGLKLISARACALAEMFFPFSAVVINWIFLGAKLSMVQIVGAIILLISSLVIQLKKY